MRRSGKENAQEGNVLILILIAVALFGALSFAVSQNTRSSSGSGSDETNLISSSALTQYPPGVRAAVIRMLIKGVDVGELAFNAPSDFDSLIDVSHAVFHPQGGNATYELAMPDLMASGAQEPWVFSGGFEVQGIGQQVSSSFDGNDIMALLIGVKEGICEKLDSRHGIGGIVHSTISSADFHAAVTGTEMLEAWLPPNSEIVLGPDGSNGTDALHTQQQGCFSVGNDSEFIYYQVLVER